MPCRQNKIAHCHYDVITDYDDTMVLDQAEDGICPCVTRDLEAADVDPDEPDL